MKKKDKIDAEKLEDEFYEKDTKLGRQERKRLSQQDRSKYKKTDFDKWKKGQEEQLIARADTEGLLRGRVIKIQSEGIYIDSNGETFLCQLRGLFKKEKSEKKTLITVGDHVLFEPGGFVHTIEPRTSQLSRAETIHHKKQQVLAANVDIIFITTSVVSPPLRPTLIDRYAIAADKGGMTPIIVVNKIDLLEEGSEQTELLKAFIASHKHAGIRVIPVSAETGEGIEALREAMKDKTSVFSGQSGVGKSSLINAATGYQLQVGDVVDRTRKGSHTTTFASLLPLSFGGWVIDTPGVKSFGIFDLSRDELQYYFPEFTPYARECKFPTCTHIHEPGCKVREHFEGSLRYASYAALFAELGEQHKRR